MTTVNPDGFWVTKAAAPFWSYKLLWKIPFSFKLPMTTNKPSVHYSHWITFLLVVCFKIVTLSLKGIKNMLPQDAALSLTTFSDTVKPFPISKTTVYKSYWSTLESTAEWWKNSAIYQRQCHDDVIKWKHFPRNWPFVRGIHRSRWIPHTKASDAELWCLLWSASE